ncbi:MAG: sugar phosphate isomerase/epimerase [Candidatus Hydrogenedentes bacterium]|nr:sugar phosphate isomerase/epimerase [Candidatus Hydrogenedentota bacterium]
MPLIGINQDSFHKAEGGFPTFEEMIEGCAELGLTLFEFCPEYLEQTPDVLTPERRRAAVKLGQSLGVKLLVHASFASVNCCFINAHTRAESVRQLKREIELAHDIESDAITIHPGRPQGHFQWYPKGYFWDMLRRSYEELLAHAEPLGVRICTENISRDFVGPDESVAQILADMDSEWFGLTLDFGHYNLIYNELPLPERMERMRAALGLFKDKIWVFHIHDNRGERDDHDALGTGQIDYDLLIPEVLRLGIDAYWSMELAGIEAARVSKAKLEGFLAG